MTPRRTLKNRTDKQVTELSNAMLAAILDGLARGLAPDKPVLARYVTESAKRLRQAPPA